MCLGLRHSGDNKSNGDPVPRNLRRCGDQSLVITTTPTEKVLDNKKNTMEIRSPQPAPKAKGTSGDNKSTMEYSLRGLHRPETTNSGIWHIVFNRHALTATRRVRCVPSAPSVLTFDTMVLSRSALEKESNCEWYICGPRICSY